MLKSSQNPGLSRIRRLVITAMLVAIYVVINRFLSISTPIVKIGFSFVASLMGGVLMGPLGGLAVGALGDFIGAILFPTGQFFPGFTVTAALTGLTYGLLLHEKQSWPRILVAVFFTRLVCGLLINTFWIHMLTGTDYTILIEARILQNVVLVPVEIVTMAVLRYAGVFRQLQSRIS